MLVPSITTLALVALAAADTYEMVKEYAGSTFFDDWQFYDHFDNLTNGNAMFVSSKQARKSHLAYVDDTTGHAIMRVDNTSKLEFGDNRNTIRIQSVDQYTVGSVWTIDMFHVPYGCSVWPAFWSHSPNWPIGGEIDTFEAINLNPRSQMGLHTTPGCKQVSQNQSSTLVNSTDCSYLANNNEGCITTIPMDESYGEKFSSSGGGVWVTEFAQNGISVWFFPRSQVPSTLSSNASTIDTSTFGIPVGNWPSTGCDMGTYFGPQNLLFTITLCGDFAGSPSIFQQSCTGFCYQDYVLGNGSNYGTAYFEVGNVRVFSKTGTNTVIKGNGAMRNGLDLTMGLGALLGIMGMVWL